MIYTILHRTLKIKGNDAQKTWGGGGINLVALEGYAVLSSLMINDTPVALFLSKHRWQVITEEKEF